MVPRVSPRALVYIFGPLENEAGSRIDIDQVALNQWFFILEDQAWLFLISNSRYQWLGQRQTGADPYSQLFVKTNILPNVCRIIINGVTQFHVICVFNKLDAINWAAYVIGYALLVMKSIGRGCIPTDPLTLWAFSRRICNIMHFEHSEILIHWSFANNFAKICANTNRRNFLRVLAKCYPLIVAARLIQEAVVPAYSICWIFIFGHSCAIATII